MKIDQVIKESRSMNEEDMEKILNEFIDTHYCTALMKYIDARVQTAVSSLVAIDVKEGAYDIAKFQGMRMGLMDIPAMLRQVEENAAEPSE